MAAHRNSGNHYLTRIESSWEISADRLHWVENSGWSDDSAQFTPRTSRDIDRLTVGNGDKHKDGRFEAETLSWVEIRGLLVSKNAFLVGSGGRQPMVSEAESNIAGRSP